MACEFYTLEWREKHLSMVPTDAPSIACDAEGVPKAPWRVHSCLGDDNGIWCEVYRTPNTNGGAFLLRDFDEPLLFAHASTNMAFVQGLDVFARMTSNSRYAVDIFTHMDDDDHDGDQ